MYMITLQHLEERLANYQSYLDEGRLHQLVLADHQSTGGSHDHGYDVTTKRLEQLSPFPVPEAT